MLFKKQAAKQKPKLSIETFNRIFLNDTGLIPSFFQTQISIFFDSFIFITHTHTHARTQTYNAQRREKTDFPNENSIHIDLICI